VSRGSLLRIGAGIAGALVVLALLVVVGRWERNRNAARQNARMEAVYRTATAQGLDSPLLDRYRLDLQADCLLYHPPGRPQDNAAYELCFDAQGRLVETIDRHTGKPQFASLREQPGLAAIRVRPAAIDRILVRRGVFALDPRIKGETPDPNALTLVNGDMGAFAFPRPEKP
jgi:hypothetical protein